MLNHKGEVAECTGDNIFLVKRGRLLTPPLDAGILEGVTRNAVIELAREAGIDVAEPALTKHDVYVADECFLTGTAAEIVPVVRVDDRVDRRRQAGAGDARPHQAVSRAGAGVESATIAQSRSSQLSRTVKHADDEQLRRRCADRRRGSCRRTCGAMPS